MQLVFAVLALLAAGLLLWGWWRGQGEHLAGLQRAWGTFVMILPMLTAALIVAGMTQVLLPPETVARWVGHEAGVRGLLLGVAGGVLTPGGPWVCFPIGAGLLQAGAGVGPVVAYLSAWSLASIHKMILQAGILGWRFTLAYLLSVLLLPLFAGWVAATLFPHWR